MRREMDVSMALRLMFIVGLIIGISCGSFATYYYFITSKKSVRIYPYLTLNYEDGYYIVEGRVTVIGLTEEPKTLHIGDFYRSSTASEAIQWAIDHGRYVWIEGETLTITDTIELPNTSIIFKNCTFVNPTSQSTFRITNSTFGG